MSRVHGIQLILSSHINAITFWFTENFVPYETIPGNILKLFLRELFL